MIRRALVNLLVLLSGPLVLAAAWWAHRRGKI